MSIYCIKVVNAQMDLSSVTKQDLSIPMRACGNISPAYDNMDSVSSFGDNNNDVSSKNISRSNAVEREEHECQDKPPKGYSQLLYRINLYIKKRG